MKVFCWMMSSVLALCLIATVVFEYLFFWKRDTVSDSAVIFSFVLAIVCVISIAVIILFLRKFEKNIRKQKIENLSKIFEQLKLTQTDFSVGLTANVSSIKDIADAYKDVFKSYANAIADI